LVKITESIDSSENNANVRIFACVHTLTFCKPTTTFRRGNGRYQTSSAVCNPSLASRPIIDSSNTCNQASAPVVCRCMDQFNSQLLGVLSLSGMFPQNCPFPSGIFTPRNILFLGPSPLIIPNDISIGSAVFVWVPNSMLYNALSMGKRTPTLPLPLLLSSLCRRRTEPQS